MELGPHEASGEPEQTATTPDPPDSQRRSPVQWLRERNHSTGVVELLRRARRALPGDPEFGDPLSLAGDGGARAAVRAAGRLLGDRDAASRQLSMGALQVLQATREAVSRRPANPEVTLVFTDLVGFSDWSLKSGDDAALTLLRHAARAVESPLLDAGGRIVKRMGDGIMAVFSDPIAAVQAACAAEKGLKSVDVDGYTPQMRVGVHTGRPQRLGSDWLGVDVNIAARVMERATKGGIMVSGPTLDKIPQSKLDELGVVAKRVHKPLFGSRPAGIPADMAIYRLQTRRELTATVKSAEREPKA
ncbi:MAG: adenylate/guanylate cyclase domain-containing protein [Mycobacterium sp.]|nr:adenylate/guanylate cyclase domain-containing protein [Mycobacterium sp.]